MAEKKEPKTWVFIVVWVLSLGLLALTTLAGGWHLGPYRVILSMCVAVLMTLLQLVFYMRLKYRNSVLRIVASSGWYWLALLFGLMFSDYLTRVYVPGPW